LGNEDVFLGSGINSLVSVANKSFIKGGRANRRKVGTPKLE
jgi:hypothetical protein